MTLVCRSATSDTDSNTLDRLEAAGADRVAERLIVLLVLVGVAFREVGDRLVELVLRAEVRGEGDGVAGSGVRPSQRLAADRARRTRASPAPSPRRPPSPSCRAAVASTGNGRPPPPSSSPGRCRSPPASAAVPAPRAHRAARSDSSGDDPPGPTRSPPSPAGTTGPARSRPCNRTMNARVPTLPTPTTLRAMSTHSNRSSSWRRSSCRVSRYARNCSCTISLELARPSSRGSSTGRATERPPAVG